MSKLIDEMFKVVVREAIKDGGFGVVPNPTDAERQECIEIIKTKFNLNDAGAEHILSIILEVNAERG